jgi:hypothetical protein
MPPHTSSSRPVHAVAAAHARACNGANGNLDQRPCPGSTAPGTGDTDADAAARSPGVPIRRATTATAVVPTSADRSTNRERKRTWATFQA